MFPHTLEAVQPFDDFTEILFRDIVKCLRRDVREGKTILDMPARETIGVPVAQAHEAGVFATDAWEIIDDTAGPLVKWWAGSDRRWFTLVQGRR